jgi:hypothetical protein
MSEECVERVVTAEADWDQKASAIIHTKKQKAPNFIQKALYFDILYGGL